MPEQPRESASQFVAVRLRAVSPLPDESRAAYNKRLRNEAHMLLRRALAASGASDEDFVRGPHGKPYLPEGTLFFNLTHCPGLAACAVGTAECGIDAEPFTRRVSTAVERRICAPEELDFSRGQPFHFFCLWTLKESFVKATGAGLSYPLRDAAFFPEPQGPRFCRDGFLFRHFVTDAHLAALCVERPGEKAHPIPLQPLTLPAEKDLTLDITF